jgi:hypothetical protein
LREHGSENGAGLSQREKKKKETERSPLSFTRNIISAKVYGLGKLLTTKNATSNAGQRGILRQHLAV